MRRFILPLQHSVVPLGFEQAVSQQVVFEKIVSRQVCCSFYGFTIVAHL